MPGVALVLVLALLAASRAVAQDAPRAVVLDVPDCMEVLGSTVKELVALELAPRMQVVAASTEPTLTGGVQCSVPVLLTVVDPARAEPLYVDLDLAAAAPLARPRLLALTLAELITTSQLERPPAVRTAEPEATQPEPDDGDDGARESPALQLWVAPSLSIAGEPALPMVGAELGVAYALGPVLLALDGQARFAQSDRSSSDVAVRALSAGLAVLPVLLDDGVQLAAGAGVRAGHAALTATSHDPDVAAADVLGLWLGPMAVASLHLPLSPGLAVRFALEGGYFARPAIGFDQAGNERIALRGPWLSLGAGLALGL